MAVILPIDGDTFRRRRSELAREQVHYTPAQPGMTAHQVASLVPAGISLVDTLTTPILGGIAEAARRDQEQKRIEEAKAAQAAQQAAQAQGAADLDAGKAAMASALEDRAALGVPTAGPEIAARVAEEQDQPPVPPIVSGTEPKQFGESAYATRFPSVPVTKGLQISAPEGENPSYDQYTSALEQVAAKRAEALRPKVAPQAAQMPAADVAPVQQFAATPRAVSVRQMRSTAAEPEVQPVRVPQTLDQLRLAAQRAGLSGDTKAKQDVLDQLASMGADAYAPQSWSELFNPSLARRRVQSEFEQMLMPSHAGKTPEEIALIMQRTKELEERRAINQAKEARAAALAPAIATLKSQMAQLNTMRMGKLEEDTARQHILNQYLDRAQEAGINRDEATAHAQETMATVGIPAQAFAATERGRYEGMNAASRRLSAEAQMERAKHPQNMFLPPTWLPNMQADLAKQARETAAKVKELEALQASGPPKDRKQRAKWLSDMQVYLNMDKLPDLLNAQRKIEAELQGARKKYQDIQDAIDKLGEQGQPQGGVPAGPTKAF